MRIELTEEKHTLYIKKTPLDTITLIILFLVFLFVNNWLIGWFYAFHKSSYKISASYDYFKVHGYELESEKLPVRYLLSKSEKIEDSRTFIHKIYSFRRLKPILVYCITDKAHKIIWIEEIRSWGFFRTNGIRIKYLIEPKSALFNPIIEKITNSEGS